MNYISTPVARRDTGLFFLEVYKDNAYESKIAELAQGIYIPAGDLAPGPIHSITVVPDENKVQLTTTYTITFVTTHTLYGDDFGGSSLTIFFPDSIGLPDTGTVVIV